ncbi:capsular biosynthesis protein [Cognatishimia sp. D5M38]|uniref:Capsular biosynthesis protein n=1 Tax=Cognatishimia coralii TaxID=3083254 RepID=A0ABU8QDI5_9RHOB
MQPSSENRSFLFLQGPHGPFFRLLADMVAKSGADIWRVGFNAGDQAFWSDMSRYIPYRGDLLDWPTEFTRIVDEKNVTDVVLYGDTRGVHAEAVRLAKARGLTVHIFEEGYLRPFWVTYERDGSNGHSRLMDITIPQMQEALAGADMESPMPPAHWGDMREHIFYGALYHWFVMFANGKYPAFQPHRALNVRQEFALHCLRLLKMPRHAIQRRIATWRIRHGGFPYHLCLLQLEHDTSFQEHSPFSTMSEFIELVVENFALGAPKHHHLVFKAHPLEDGRVKVRSLAMEFARKYGVADRVHFVRGGKLAQLLNETRSVVTVNSTAGQQALWRGIPVKIFGKAVYDQPEFISDLSLRNFFAEATRPDMAAYRDYRRFLLETSQIAGGFYAHRGRQQLLRQVVDMMLAKEDPYAALQSGRAAPRQQLRAIS